MNKHIHPINHPSDSFVNENGTFDSKFSSDGSKKSFVTTDKITFKPFVKALLVFLFSISSLIVKGQLAAKFTASDTAGCSPLVVRFTNASTGATSYSWDLGNGSTSALTDASVTYTTAGTYTVTLTAYSGSSSSNYSMVVRIYGKPIVNFSASDTTLCENQQTNFTSTSTPNAWGGISYIWNFGDGGSSTATAPSYSYPSPGAYNVTLFATNGKGCSNSFTRNSYISVSVPAAAIFGATTTNFCSAPATASFINGTTGKAPLTYTWAFGDGGASTVTSPIHTYSSPAKYDVKLIVRDGFGCVDSSLQLNYITLGNIKAAFTPVANGCLNVPVTFKNASSAHIFSQWYFGDGGSSSSDTPSYSYSTTGTYTVKLIIFDGSCYDSVTHTITITKPTGSFTITPICPLPYSTQTFTGSVPTGTTVNWHFGDGTNGTGATVTHTYSPPAYMLLPPPNPDPVYKTAMIITNSLGCTDTIKAPDTVRNLVIQVTADPQEGCLPLLVRFRADAFYHIINPFPPCKGCDLLTFPYPKSFSSYVWDFGDGSPTSTSSAPSHVYTATGVYSATCKAVMADGCSATNNAKVTVGSQQTASFFMTKTHVCAGHPIIYTSTSTSTSYIDVYAWDFGDGKQASGPASHGYNIVSHSSELPGIHQVKLLVYYNGCKSNVDSLADTIDAPSAIITNKYSCVPANEMAFADSSKGDDTHLWQFGDGTTSTAYNPVHLYPSLSSYRTTLTTYNATSGCRDTSSILVELQRLSETLVPYHANICRDLVDTFTTAINTTDSTQPMTSLWYVNGSIIDTSIPAVIPSMVPNPPYADTIYHPMLTKGSNNVTLILIDNHGCLDTISKIVTVVKPTDSFSISPTVACPATAVIFTDHSTDITGFSPTKYNWSFGDGSSSSSGSPVVTHSYTVAGTYTVKETVTDNLGCSDTLTGPTHPLVHKPEADFVAGSTYNCKGTVINFDNKSIGGVNWLWVFGDGATSTISIPSHTYTTVGDYTVKLIAMDTYGCTDTSTQNNLISINPLPTASFHMDDSFAVCAPLNVNFINTSIGASFNNWSFGDGTFSTGVYPSDIYITPGIYTVKLKVSNSYGCIDTAIGHAVVFGYAGGFSYTPSSACASAPVHFSAAISGVISVVWDFNDGFISNPSFADTISHAYMTPGKYIPKLILTDLSNCSSFSEGIDTIKVDTLIAKFSSSPEPVCQNSNITFHDSSFARFSAPNAWLWTFASGATSTARAPVYAYSVSGSMPVTLLVTNGFGCTGTFTKNVTVNPVPKTISGQPDICLGEGTTLSDITSGGFWSSLNTAVATIGTSTGIITSLTAGTSTIAYTFVTGCRTVSTETVNPLPAPITGIKVLCAGTVLPLSDPTPGGSWSISNTAIAAIGSGSGIVTGGATGTATITYQLPTGCIATSIIKVDSSPSVVSGPAALCAGDTITLSDNIGGGNWSSSNTAAVSINAVTGIATGTSAGSATITYVLSTGCKTTTTITTNPLPSLISGPANVCKGLTTTLTDITTGGTWSSHTTTVATVSSGTVNGISAGTSTITYKLVTGCLASKTITVNPLPSPITGTTNVCVKLTTTFSDASPGGSWSSPDLTIGIGSLSGIVTGVSTGSASITYTLSSGCTTTLLLTVNPIPSIITGQKNICIGLTTTLSDDTTAGVWTSPDPSVSIGPGTGIAKGLIIGTATIFYTLRTGCYATTMVTVNPIPSAITGNKVLCAGSKTALSDSVSGGVWSSSPSSVASIDGAGLVTGVTAGTATITYTSGASCVALTTVTVHPVIAPISGKNVLCKGTTIALSDAISGGIWSSSNKSVAGIDASGIVSGLAVGSTTITYFAANTCDTATSIVVVNPLPNAGTITGNTKICTGTSSALIDSIAGGVWTSANTSIATVDVSGVATGISAGVADITYSFTNSCGTAKTGVALTINQTPASVHISTHPDSSLCANTLFQNFGADMPEPPGTHYTWSAPKATIYATSATRQYCLISFSTPGTTIVKLSTSQSVTDCYNSDSLVFKVSGDQSPNPAVVYYPPEFVCRDNTADSYQWGYDDVHTLDSTLLRGMINQNYYNSNPDFQANNYWVLTYHNGCLQKSYYNIPESISNTSQNSADIIIFPNPAGSEINIEIKGINRQGLTDVRLYDILGKERNVSIIVDGRGKINLSGLAPDVYMLLFSKNGIKIGSKIFVKN